MGRDSALGHDPLGWMKITKENKKTISTEDVNAAGQIAAKNDQQANSEITAKQHALFPSNNDTTPNIPKVSQPSDKVNRGTDNTVAPKPRVVIGRLYEKQQAEKTKSVLVNEGAVQESEPYVRPPFPVARTMQAMKDTGTELNRALFSLSSERFSTYIIVAYTALILILGYFVYNDLSKRMSRVEARLFVLEKALQSKSH